MRTAKQWYHYFAIDSCRSLPLAVAFADCFGRRLGNQHNYRLFSDGIDEFTLTMKNPPGRQVAVSLCLRAMVRYSDYRFVGWFGSHEYKLSSNFVPSHLLSTTPYMLVLMAADEARKHLYIVPPWRRLLRHTEHLLRHLFDSVGECTYERKADET